MIGNFASACSFGPLWVSPSFRQTVADTPSSVFLAPQPPPSGPKVPMKNSERLRIEAVEARRHQIGVMAGDDAIRESPAAAP